MIAVVDAIRPPEPPIERAHSVLFGDRCQAPLLQDQNPDGGWPYRPGSLSAVEPTAWAIMALHQVNADGSEPAREVGVKWLRSAQLDNGAWPSRPGEAAACWTTALAARALYMRSDSQENGRRGLHWLCNTWPAEGGFWWQVRHRLRRGSGVIEQNSALRGWSWVPQTASWVEPTAHALSLINEVPASDRTKLVAERQKLGEAMLYNRMCPGGGWNSGNPLVYGVAGEPRVGPTAWALMALEKHLQRDENRKSLDWLERIYPSIAGPESKALAYLCLRRAGRHLPPLEATLESQYATNGFLGSTLATAWALMVFAQ